MQYEYGVTRGPKRIIFGSGQRKALGVTAKSLGQRALICTDAYLGSLPLLGELVTDMQNQGLQVKVFDGTEAELPLDGIRECVKQYRDFDPDVFIGIGGGSCMDLAKVVSLLMTYAEPASQYYGEFKVPGPTRPVIAMPTTAGTGSEVTPVAVLADPERSVKVGISSPELIPDVAICDPELTLTCPKGLTAITGTDALSHAIESFSARRREPEPHMERERVFVGKNILSDHYALAAIELIYKNLAQAVEDGSHIEARSAMMLGSMYAGMSFSTAGTCAAHAIQYPIGALTHTAHGLGIGALLPYTMDFNLEAAASIYARAGQAMGLAHQKEDMLAAKATIKAVRELLARIGIPKTIKELGVKESDLDAIAEQSLNAKRLAENNPCDLDVEGVRAILGHAMRGTQ